MISNKNTGRIIGVLFLLLFISGVIVFQFLQGPILFADDFLTLTSHNSNKIIISTLLEFLSGIISIIIASILIPILKKYNYSLAFLYLGFCIVNFIVIAIDNISVLSLLELSQEYVKNGTNNSVYFESLGKVFYKTHWWTHYSSLLISCFPGFVFFYAMFSSRLIPVYISVPGIIAVLLMFIEMLFSFFGNSIGMYMMAPLGIIQLFLSFWLIVKGLDSHS